MTPATIDLRAVLDATPDTNPGKAWAEFAYVSYRKALASAARMAAAGDDRSADFYTARAARHAGTALASLKEAS